MDESLVRLYPDLEENHFWWRVRRDLVLNLIEQRIPLNRASVLDIGCGSGRTLDHLAHHGAHKLKGVEIDRSFQESAVGDPSRIEFGDFMEMEFEDRFDVILMLDVIEHIDADAVAVKRASALLQDDGILVVTVPAYQWLWSQHDDLNRHYRRYTTRKLRLVLDGTGLVVEQLGYMFSGLIVPKALVKFAEKAGFSASEAATSMTHDTPLSRLSYSWFSKEAKLARRRSKLLPFGTSVVAVARRG